MSSPDSRAGAWPRADARAAEAALPRGDRRRARTRMRLIGAAREFLTSPAYPDRSIAEITEAADVGLGSFYNHFESKDELFTAAVNEVLDEHGALLDATAGDSADPAERLALAIRSTARLMLTHPEMAQILANQGMAILDMNSGIIPRVSSLLEAGIRGERFVTGDARILLTAIVGSLLGGLHLWLREPGSVDDEWCSALTERLLVLCGIEASEASALARATY